MASLSVIIPARNEEFLGRTVDDLVAKMRGDTEIIAVCDGAWPDPPLFDHPRVHVLHYTESIGQRAATNAGARLSQATYMMKLDAHCMVDEGFDVKLSEPYETGEITADTTTIPRMYNIYAFDWVCPKGHRRYQSPSGPCLTCGQPTERDMIWRTRLSKKTDFARFDTTPQFKYHRDYKTRPEAQGDIVDVMSSVGACFFMRRDRFFELGGLDEKHGSWGACGIEVACKSWLSGGRQVVNKRTWFGHLFRTQGGDFGFPYPIDQAQQEHAKAYARDLWFGNKWPGQVRPLSWLIEKFSPLPVWHDPEGSEILATVMEAGRAFCKPACRTHSTSSQQSTGGVNSSRSRQEMTSDAVDLPAVDSWPTIGTEYVGLVGNQSDVSRIPTPSIVANNVIKDGGIATSSFGQRCNEPSVHDAMHEFCGSERMTLAISTGESVSSPLPASGVAVHADLREEPCELLRVEMRNSEILGVNHAAPPVQVSCRPGPSGVDTSPGPLSVPQERTA